MIYPHEWPNDHHTFDEARNETQIASTGVRLY